jgi:cob(I)alamin adenosyltransferase
MTKIYTKTGDKGKTSLFTGEKVSKDHPRLEAYGTIDELISWVGMINAYDLPQQQKETLTKIQSDLFSICSHVACDSNNSKNKEKELPPMDEHHVQFIEHEIDFMNKNLPELRGFIFPAGDPQVVSCHIARTVCRRAERHVVAITDKENTNNFIISFLNRLSDYFFVLARYTAHKKKIVDILWKKNV